MWKNFIAQQFKALKQQEQQMHKALQQESMESRFTMRKEEKHIDLMVLSVEHMEKLTDLELDEMVEILTQQQQELQHELEMVCRKGLKLQLLLLKQEWHEYCKEYSNKITLLMKQSLEEINRLSQDIKMAQVWQGLWGHLKTETVDQMDTETILSLEKILKEPFLQWP